MSLWWQRRRRRLLLAFWIAAAGISVLAFLAGASQVLGFWKPEGRFANVPILVCFGVATLLLFGSGYFIAGRALAPFRETVELARTLSARPERKRLVITNPNDELGELAVFLNELLARLHGSFAELDRLAADISHELRTPLTAMRAVGEVAMRERNPAILYDAVGSILEEIRRMNQLIDRLLLLTRHDSDQWPVRLKPGKVRNILIEVSETLSLVAQDKQQQLRVSCPDELNAVFDAALLRLALMNLAQNAIRYSPPGAPILLRGDLVNGEAVVEVADNGPGIAPEHQHKIFERFYRLDEARSRAEGGVGLGLAIVKWAIERMGGTVELLSQIGKGSTFRVRLGRAVSAKP